MQIRWMLEGIDGDTVVRNMSPEDILVVVLDLKKKEGFTYGELLTVAKSIMKRE